MHCTCTETTSPRIQLVYTLSGWWERGGVCIIRLHRGRHGCSVWHLSCPSIATFGPARMITMLPTEGQFRRVPFFSFRVPTEPCKRSSRKDTTCTMRWHKHEARHGQLLANARRPMCSVRSTLSSRQLAYPQEWS